MAENLYKYPKAIIILSLIPCLFFTAITPTIPVDLSFYPLLNKEEPLVNRFLELNEELKKADGIILTGGADIHPARYGQIADTVKCGTIDTYRDSIEFLLLSHIDEFGTPCIGFCRGLQIMNVYNGGSLHLHLPDTLTSIHRGPEGKTAHTISVIKHIASVNIPVGQMNKIVSNHHQGIAELGNGMEVWAIAPDGLSEGIRRSDTLNYPFYVGVQWHPELCEPGNEFDEAIGQSFINAVISD